MRIAKVLCFSLVISIIFPGFSSAEVGPMSLAEMIKYSDCIVVGKIVRTKINRKNIAEIAVSQNLKGDSSLRRVRFSSAPLWACDVSAAVENEQGLFFLQKDPFGDPALRALPPGEHDGVPLFFLAHSGRGRIIIQNLDGEDYVYAHKKSDLRFPTSLHYARYPKPEDSELGLIRLSDVVAYVSKRV